MGHKQTGRVARELRRSQLLLQLPLPPPPLSGPSHQAQERREEGPTASNMRAYQLPILEFCTGR